MRKYLKTLLLLIVTLSMGAQAPTKPNKITVQNVGVTRDFHAIRVYLAANDETLDTLKSHTWNVVVGDGAGQSVSVRSDLKTYQRNVLTIALDSPPAFTPTTCLLVLDVKTSTACQILGRDDDGNPADKDKGKGFVLSDYLWSVTGSYSPAIGSKAQYTLSSAGLVQFAWCGVSCGQSSFRNYYGANYSIDMDKRNDVDPDSFTGSILYKFAPSTRHRASLWIYPAGVEANRRDPVLNFVSAGVLSFPIHTRGDVRAGSLLVNGTVSMGLEGGDNVNNAVTGGGTGAFVRGLGGADLGIKLAPADGITVHGSEILKDIKITSTYRVRLPAMNELLTTPVDTDTSTYSLSTKPRNYVKSELDFEFKDWLALTITHEHGALPPGFKAIGQSLTIGLKATLDKNQNSSWLGGFTSR